MSLQKSTLRPGLLVSLKTSIRGNVSYNKRDLEAGVDPSGAVHTKWETERTIRDPQEHESAVKLRGQICSIIRRECSLSSFGLLCPEAKFDALESALKVARTLAEDFNSRAVVTRIGVFVIVGRVADSDVEAVRAINSEISDLIATMASAVKNLDAKAVREAANRIKAMGQMLSPEASKRAEEAIEIARKAARKIVAVGQTAATEIDQATVDQISACRAAFIDFEMDAGEIEAPTTQARGVDFQAMVVDPAAAPASTDPDAPALEAIDMSANITLEHPEVPDPFADLVAPSVPQLDMAEG